MLSLSPVAPAVVVSVFQMYRKLTESVQNSSWLTASAEVPSATVAGKKIGQRPNRRTLPECVRG
ncbi:hypothetical protein, partial [Mycolicibacterium fortuitum]|uniref:hypothetical protein n=1 Tax=Mycolicibacterium fortuitum TaxID=1766 RepID=UPI000B2E1656